MVHASKWVLRRDTAFDWVGEEAAGSSERKECPPQKTCRIDEIRLSSTGMEEMSAANEHESTDGALKAACEDNHHHHREHQQRRIAAARRHRMEIRRLRSIANAASFDEPVSKRSRPCFGDLKPYFHVITITTTSSFQACDDDEGEGECIPVIQNDNMFEPAISSPSLQQDPVSLSSSTTADNGLPIDYITSEEEKEKEDSLTLETHTTPPNSITTNLLASDDSVSLGSGEFCSIMAPNDCTKIPNTLPPEKDGVESPNGAQTITNTVISIPVSVTNTVTSGTEESLVAGATEQELLRNLDLQSVSEIVASADVDSSNLTVVSVPSTSGGSNGGNGSGGKSGCVANNRILPWGSSSVCGRRAEMEDAMAAVPGFLSVPCGTVGGCTARGSEKSKESSALHFFGVYDGHGGSQAANFCKDRLHHALAEEFEVAVNGESSSADVGSDNNWQGKWEKAFMDCFHKVDAEVGGGVYRRDGDGEVVVAECCPDPVAPETVGSTAVVAVVGSCQIIVSNCGDSRAVLSRGGRAIALSVDHKPEREDESARIEAAGGKVIRWNGYRVFGVLAMSRAIGMALGFCDRYLKPSIISDPEVTFTQRTEEDECLILASDGLWDVLTNEEVCEVARRRLARGHNSNASSSKLRDEAIHPSAQAAAEYLSRLALQRNSDDNITVVVVDLKARRRRQSKN
eukprot:Gb_40094 [translate_table: standard]